jgi:hypothetical protein
MSIASNYALRLPASLKREVEKVARADIDAALEVMSRERGEVPREGDEV